VPNVPLPTCRYRSVDCWQVQVNGEYGRFEVTATDSAPVSPTTTTPIRRELPVELERPGQQRRVGHVDAINVSASTAVRIREAGVGVSEATPRGGRRLDAHDRPSAGV